MDNILHITLLYDFYGGLLTDKQRQSFEMYHLDDLSLHEIASELSITRQAVSRMVNNTKQILIDYESRLGLVEKHLMLSDKIIELENKIDELEKTNKTNFTEIRILIDEIKSF